MYTEEEAKKKWCPHIRKLEIKEVKNSSATHMHMTNDVVMASYNVSKSAMGDESGRRHTTCIASECMMFRFVKQAQKTLSNGMVVTVDDRDIDLLIYGYWWDGRYAKNKTGYLHRAIVTKHYGEIPKGMVIDHKDRNPLNNSLNNLRICTQAENTRNSKGRGGKSKYKGVFKNRQGKWTAQISRKGKPTL